MKKHYRVDNEAQKIIANIEKLTEEEFVVIEKYKRLGYTVENGKVGLDKRDDAPKRLTDEYIREYLKGNEEALEKYQEAIDEIAYEADGKTVKTTSTGKPRTRGFNAGRNYFARNFPKDLKELSYTKPQEKAFKSAWMKYSKARGAEMTEAEYKRYYYWTKIFEDK